MALANVRFGSLAVILSDLGQKRTLAQRLGERRASTMLNDGTALVAVRST